MVIKKKSCVISNDLAFFPMGVTQFWKTFLSKISKVNKIISSSPCLNYLYIASFEVGIILTKALF